MAGAAIAYAVKDKVGSTGVAAVMAATLIPDADMVLEPFGSEVYLQYHRVVLNSLPAVLLLSTVVACAAWWFGRYKNFPALWGLSFSAMALHAMMDMTNSYGGKPMWPFVNKWSALDIVFIVDVWIVLIFAAGIFLMWRYKRRGLVLAGCFLILFTYWGVRGFMHHRALALFKVQYPEAMSIGAFPAPVIPAKWRMVAETRDAYWCGWYNIVTGNWESVEMFPRTPADRVLLAAREARVAKIFLEFARYPYVSYIQNGDGWTVSMQDLRFSGLGGGRGFIVTVKVRPDGTADDGSFSFRKGR